VTRQGILKDESGFDPFELLDGVDGLQSAFYSNTSAFKHGLLRVAEIGALASIGAKIGWPESLLENAKE
jgi:hypothetical protein